MELEVLKTILLNGGAGLVALLTLIEISPIKINPWHWIAKKLGAAFNVEQTEKIDALAKKVDEIEKATKTLEERIEENEAKHARIRILEFCDDLLKGEPCSQENFENILRVIDCYEEYCKKHDGFKNNVAAYSIKVIKKKYEYCLENRCFLQDGLIT